MVYDRESETRPAKVDVVDCDDGLVVLYEREGSIERGDLPL